MKEHAAAALALGGARLAAPLSQGRCGYTLRRVRVRVTNPYPNRSCNPKPNPNLHPNPTPYPSPNPNPSLNQVRLQGPASGCRLRRAVRARADQRAALVARGPGLGLETLTLALTLTLTLTLTRSPEAQAFDASRHVT